MADTGALPEMVAEDLLAAQIITQTKGLATLKARRVARAVGGITLENMGAAVAIEGLRAPEASELALPKVAPGEALVGEAAGVAHS